jgi:large subunit ribosomal protein L4
MGDVNGTNKKPWRQKGTGRARAGSFASPLWRGGGVTFGPKPRDFSKKINQTTRQLALRKALSERIKASDVIVVDDIKLTSGKTKEFTGLVKNLGLGKSAVIVTEAIDNNLRLASRNVSHVEVTTSDLFNTYQALKADKLVFTKGAFEKVEQRLSK